MKKQRTELVERSFEHTLDRCGGMRRVWLRGRKNIQNRYVLRVAGFNFGLLMRLKTGHGTPMGWGNAYFALIWINQHPAIVCLAIVILTEETRLHDHAGGDRLHEKIGKTPFSKRC